MATKTRTKAKPADTCRLTVRIRSVDYTARPVRPETPEVTRAWRLRRADGETYTVADTTDGATCECMDFLYRHDGRDQDGCKHIRALRVLGLIDCDGDGFESWPSWTDTHAFTTSAR